METRDNHPFVSNQTKKLKNQFIKQGHIVFHEKRLFTENHRQVNQAILKFREWREEFELEHASVNATDIPQPFTDLIALLSHESDQTLDTLAQHINDILTPFESNEEARDSFLKVIRQIIKVTAYQERYGLADVVLLLKGSPATIPERLSIYRWQAYDTSKFPSEIRQVASKRREKRKLFSRQLTDTFQNLPADEKIDLLFNENKTLFDQTEPSPLFDPFKQDPYISLTPTTKQPRKRLCSSFDTLFYVGLNNSFDLRQRFLNELSPTTKRKRGIRLQPNIDMKKAWLASTTAVSSNGGQTSFYDSKTYKDIRSLKMKLIQFYEDVRPAYYGTWSKPSAVVNGRRPFAKDTKVLNYDYDSEAEWDYDVEGDDIHTLDPDEDDEDMLPEMSDEEEMIEEDEEVKWVVPEGYLSEDEEILDKKKSRARHRIVSRPAKWPISGSKHFPMKPVILGPSFESIEEPDNHPLSDFKIHMLVDLKTNSLGYSPFNQIIDSENDLNDTAVKETDESDSAPLTICFEPNKVKPPLFQREIDKIVNSYKEELISIILENKTKTMMGLVTVLKSKKVFSEYTTAQLQAMIHDVAVQEMRGTNKEYNWYLRVTSPIRT